MDIANFFSLSNLTGDFWIRFLLAAVFTFTLTRYLYSPVRRNRDLSFSLMVFGIAIFLVVTVLKGSDFPQGLAFGLFAIFSILRYRAEDTSAKDLTFLFVVIAMSTLNAVAGFGYLGLILVNVLMLLIVAAAQNISLFKTEHQTTVQYEKIELIRPQRQAELIQDLEQRLGLSIDRVEIGEVDFLRDIANLRVFYQPQEATRLGLPSPTVRVNSASAAPKEDRALEAVAQGKQKGGKL
jgi:apolipoprotein N-acyltransferase